ncbi:MAG: tetratricopeptide repeat protein [Armatimonadetes bacterium]|nr:tetratricopeptide repeat protein [Armatimonadota bacterium]MDW8027739.1 tetratricopeptide repeat protein [Armatimonadota bacterium]
MLDLLKKLIRRREPKAEELRRKALKFLRQSKPHRAFPLLQRSLELEPSSMEGHINAGVALYLMHRYDEALKHFQFAAALDPQNATALINLAATLDALGRIDEALSVLRKLVNLFPNMPDVHYNLAVALAKKGLNEEAVAELRTELERNPSHSHALKLLQQLIRR